jgi:Transposase
LPFAASWPVRRGGGATSWTAAAKGLAGVTVSCEPAGHRWRVLGQLAADRSMPFVCVQPMVTSWSRRTEDLTFDKTDEKEAVLIARLTAQLRCYIPEPVDETWGRLRHLGTWREQLITEAGSQIQQMRDLLECAWPAGRIPRPRRPQGRPPGRFTASGTLDREDWGLSWNLPLDGGLLVSSEHGLA